MPPGRVFIFLFLFFSCAANTARSQNVPDSIVSKIDKVFQNWDSQNSPGCAIGIVRNDSLIFSKGYGMANLEYGIPITDTTIFHVASVSKQFTAFCIILLAHQGKLNIDDDIRKYLTWFPDMHRKITIRNLYNHTSGIRDQWQLLATQGTRLEDVITEDHVIKLMTAQRSLNFEPGEQYMYSNSGFSMLGEIIKSVTGQTLRQFADSAIFKPLGMNHTHFHDDYTEIVRNRADSYNKLDSAKFSNSILSYSTAGATSLFITIRDMAKWINNFYDHKVGDEKDFALFTQKGKLKNGKEISYAAGIVSGTHKGWREFAHSGGDAGFRSYITILPDLKMGAVIFSNSGDFNPSGRTYDALDLFVTDTVNKKTKKAESKSDTTKFILKKDSVGLKKYLGTYVSEDGTLIVLKIINRYLNYGAYGRDFLLKKDAIDRYSMYSNPEVKFSLAASGKDTTISVTSPDEDYTLKKYDTTHKTDEQLKEFTGRYYSSELDCSYGIKLKDHQLVLTSNKYDDAQIRSVGPDHLFTDNWWMSHLKMIRDQSNTIIGFEVNSGRVMHLRFDKTPALKDQH